MNRYPEPTGRLFPTESPKLSLRKWTLLFAVATTLTSCLSNLILDSSAISFTFCGFVFLGLTLLLLTLIRLWQERNSWQKASEPLQILLLTAALVFVNLVILPEWDLAFYWRLGKFEAAAKQIADTQTEPARYGLVPLPAEFKHLSQEGRVRVANEAGVISILFVTGSGIPGEYSRYLWRSADRGTRHIWCDLFRPVRFETPHWYRCGS